VAAGIKTTSNIGTVGSMRSLTVVNTGVWLVAGLVLLLNVGFQDQWIPTMVMVAMFLSTGVAALSERRTGISVTRDYRENAPLAVRRVSTALLVVVSLVYIVLAGTWAWHVFL
jgi:hypothetical protein